MDLMHELVSALKDLALELGRVPNKREFCNKVKGGNYKVDALGGFTVLLQAAGLPTYDERRNERKINNSIFNKDLATHLEQYEPAQPMPPPVYTPFGKYPTIMSISDIHYPFANHRLIKAFIDRAADVQPEYIFINGDAWDMYSHSKYPKSLNVFTPRQEQEMSREMNAEFWELIKQASPNSKLIQKMGNHDVRPMKRVLEVYPEAEDWIQDGLAKLFTFDGVQTDFDPREETLLGDIAIFHGYRTQLGSHRDYTLYNTINGHTHKGGSVFRKIRNTTLWELNSGVAGDPLSKGLSYTPQKITDQTPGWGEVDRFGPRFVPFL